MLRLMGIETEYALVVRRRGGGIVGREQVVRRLMAAAGRVMDHLPDGGGGMFLGNGSRFYIDHGLHPELATPECSDPWEVVRYVEAGHRILASLLEELRRKASADEIHLFRCNVDYTGSQSTWGCHESYMHRADPRSLPDELIPHLVTRIIYSGSGGFDPRAARPRFTLSPRSCFMERVHSSNSTHGRGVFHTKNESLASEGYNRLHVVFGESTCSETATFLKTGTTALIVALVEAGVRPSEGLAMPATLSKLRTVAEDPWCGAQVAEVHGRPATAVDVQRRYLECVRANIGQPSMPDWAPEVCAVWGATLDRLEAGAPASVAGTLDWAMKHAVYADYFERRGWAAEPLDVLGRVANWFPPSVLGFEGTSGPADSSGRSLDPEKVEMATRHLGDHGLSLGDLDRYLMDRNRLYEADVRWSAVGGDSIFAKLDAAGQLDHRVDGVGDVLRAQEEPPSRGRARVRGQVIHRISGQRGVLCDWNAILTRTQRLDLSDPLIETEGEWADLPKGQKGGRDAGADGLFRRLTAFVD